MKTYAEAYLKVGTTEVCSYASGRTRFLRWSEAVGGAIFAEIYDTAVVTFYPDRVEVRTAGHPAPSTFDAISTALETYGARVAYTVARVPYVYGERMTEPTVLDYSGHRVGAFDLNDQLSPLAPARRADLAVVDVAQDAAGHRVTVRDWTYDARDHSHTARKLAAAYVGRPQAATAVVGRWSYPTTEEPHLSILVKTEA